MRFSLAGCVLAMSSVAHADRAVVDTISVTTDIRAHGHTFSEANDSKDVSVLGGARLTLTFEQPAIAPRATRGANFDFRLVPELFTGALADAKHAEGYLGAGVRGELHVASRRDATAARVVSYVPVRAILIGGHQDPAVEFGIGQYFPLRDHRRVGYECTGMLRKRPDGAPAEARELDMLLSVFVGW
jgi:hypothetical protein